MATTASPTWTSSESPVRQRLELDLARIDLDDGHVAPHVDADQLAGDALRLAAALVEDDGDAARTLTVLVHDVRVGQDVALLVYDEARAERLCALRLAERVGAGAAELGEHHDHAAGQRAVDLLRREPVAGRRPGWGGVGGGRLRRRLDHRLVHLTEVEDEHEEEHHRGRRYGAAGEPRQESLELHACFPSSCCTQGGRTARPLWPISVVKMPPGYYLPSTGVLSNPGCGLSLVNGASSPGRRALGLRQARAAAGRPPCAAAGP